MEIGEEVLGDAEAFDFAFMSLYQCSVKLRVSELPLPALHAMCVSFLAQATLQTVGRLRVEAHAEAAGHTHVFSPHEAAAEAHAVQSYRSGSRARRTERR